MGVSIRTRRTRSCALRSRAGLELDEIEEIENATSERVDLGTIDRSALSKEDRLFVYAIACWIARLDGEVTEEESEARSARSGERLGIPERPRVGDRRHRARDRASSPRAIARRATTWSSFATTIGERLKKAEARGYRLKARWCSPASAKLHRRHVAGHARHALDAAAGKKRDRHRFSRGVTRSCASSGEAAWVSCTCVATSPRTSASR